MTETRFNALITITKIYNLAINRQINQERLYMPKNEAKVKDVLEASKEILASNSGKISYQAWRDALTEKIGPHESSLNHIVKHKLVIFWLEGFDENKKPIISVVDDKGKIVPTIPLVEPKIKGA